LIVPDVLISKPPIEFTLPVDIVTGVFNAKFTFVDARPFANVVPEIYPLPETRTTEIFLKLNASVIMSVSLFNAYVQKPVAIIFYFLLEAITPQIIKPNTTTPPPIKPILAPVLIEPQNEGSLSK